MPKKSSTSGSHGAPQTSRAVSTTRLSFASCCAKLRALPREWLAKPHCGEIARFSKGKKVIVGLVSTKTPVLESKDFLRRRIDQAALHFPLENLALSPQCGFASHSRGSALSFAQQEAKLRRVVETAREVWG